MVYSRKVKTDMRYTEYEALARRQWKAITYDWNILDTYDNTVGKLYCLTDRQAAWLICNVEYLRWQTRQNNSPYSNTELLDLAGDLEYRLMACFDVEPYQIQTIYDATIDAERNRYQELYDAGGIAELNSNTPTDFYSGDDSPERIDALCMAIDTYVRSYVADWINKAQAAQTALNFSAFAVSFVPYIGKIAAVALKGLSIITQVAIDAMSDSAAIDAVICCMESSLNGAAVNEINFENSLNACGFAVGSNEAIVRDIIGADLDGFQNWLTFLNALGDAYVWMLAGVDYICPCAPPINEQCWSWVGGSNGWTDSSSTSEFVAQGFRMRTNQQFAIGALRFTPISPNGILTPQVDYVKVTWDASAANISLAAPNPQSVEYTYTDATNEILGAPALDLPATGFVGEIQYNLPPSNPAKTLENVRFQCQKNSGNSGTLFATQICLGKT